MSKINWNTNFLIPKFLKNIIPENLYKIKLLKNFIIVSMLRNYNDSNSLIINKYLVTKPIETNNLEVSFVKKVIINSNHTEEYNCSVFKVIIHINNKFNPTNINLFDKNNKFHIFILDGDNTLHINIGLLTLFNILSSDNENIVIRKSKTDVDYFLPNSKLAWFITRLIKDKTITLYKKDSSGILSYDSEYVLNSGNKFDPLKFSYNYKSNFYWRYDLRDILIFYHNIWWSIISIMFYLYNINYWLGDIGQNTNKFRLKTYILQLLGGFSNLNLLEKVERSQNEHYVMSDKNFMEVKSFGKNLLKHYHSDNKDNIESLLINLNNSLVEQIKLTESITTKLDSIVIKGRDIIEDSFEDYEGFNNSSLLSSSIKNLENHTFTESDDISLIKSNQEFILNYKFNVMLIYLLLLEVIINLIFNLIKKRLDIFNLNERLKDNLFILIYSYTQTISNYNNLFLNNNNLIINVPSDFPNPLNLEVKRCYCDHLNCKTNTLTLLFSNLNLEINFYSSSELNNFCKTKCLNSNSLKNNINKESSPNIKLSDNINNSDNVKPCYSTNNNNNFNSINRKYSTLINKNNNSTITRTFSSSSYNYKDQLNLEGPSHKNINYNKSIFSILDKIKELTKDGNYNPQEVQLKMENFWTDIIKEKYDKNTYKAIQDLQPHVYEVFILNDPSLLKKSFPDLYMFLDDIRIYFITYTVISTYFRRSSRTYICNLVADQILFFIFKFYFTPVIKEGSIKLKKSKTTKEFSKESIWNSLSKAKKNKLEKLINLPELTKNSFIKNNNNKKNNNVNLENKDNFISNINFILEKIKLRNKIKLKDIKYKDFVDEICLYSKEYENKLKSNTNFSSHNLNYYESQIELENKLNRDLNLTIFKIKLGEWFVSDFEENGVINQTWRNGMRNIDILDSSMLSKDEIYSLEFNDKLIKNNIDKLTNILPTNLPMLCQPNKWSDTTYGGYLNNNLEKNSLITGLGIDNDHQIQNLDKLYLAVNYLNSIKFRVNTELLNFISENNKLVFEKYYSLEKSLNNDKLNDNILRDKVTLEIAKTFKDIPFYLNTYADWRGRIYTHSHYLSYQSSDLSLAFINFYEGQYINEKGLYFLKVYGANLHDENKISKVAYKDRIQWVNDNENKILNLDIDFILKADSRFSFIAFCLAYKNYKEGKKVHLPIFLDATCSGIQHFSTILKDIELAKSVNVIPDPESSGLNEKVRDIYTEMIEPTKKKISDFVDRNPSYLKLININITRKLIKPTIMTVPYNVTVIGVWNQLISNFETIPKNKLENYNKQIKENKSFINNENIIENFNNEIVSDINEYYGLAEMKPNFIIDSPEKNINLNRTLFKVPSIIENESLYLTSSEVYQLAKIMHESLFDYYPALKQLFEYFVSVCLAFTKLDIPILWFPPSGLSITQRYLKTAKAKVSISVGHAKKKTIVLNKKLNETNSIAQTQAIIPNIIHSMDAAHLIFILNKSTINNPVISIHDCFGTLPNNMIDLEDLVKQEFINLYSTNEFLDKFNSDLINILDKCNIYYEINRKEHKVYIYLDKSVNTDFNLTSNKNKNRKLEPITFWLPPKVGSLNLQDIKESNYLIT